MVLSRSVTGVKATFHSVLSGHTVMVSVSYIISYQERNQRKLQKKGLKFWRPTIAFSLTDEYIKANSLQRLHCNFTLCILYNVVFSMVENILFENCIVVFHSALYSCVPGVIMRALGHIGNIGNDSAHGTPAFL